MVDQRRSPRRKPKPVPAEIKLPDLSPGMNRKAPKDLLPYDLKGGKPGSDKQDKPSAKDDEKILERMAKRMERCITSEAEKRKAAVLDLRFLAGDQWPADIAAQRATDKRPCLTVNRLPTFVAQVTNAQRENRPSINVSPVGDRGDKEAAKIYRGLMRFIERQSRADIAYDTAFFNAVANGFGYFRIDVAYEDERSFDQYPRIMRIRNPFTVYLDPDHQEPDGADCRFGFQTEVLPKDVFEDEYPDAQPVPWDQGGQGEKFKAWVSSEGIRVCEYFEVVEKRAKLYELNHGEAVWASDLDPKYEDLIVDERWSAKRCVDYYKATRIEILERKEWLGSRVPIIPVIGTEIDVEGKVMLSGIVRHAIDAQRMLNYWNTTEAELVALAPKAPWLMAEGQDEGYEAMWRSANRKSYPVLKYKPDSVDGHLLPPPQRTPPGPIPEGVVNAKQGAGQDLMTTTGIRFDPSVMPTDLRESGRMIREQRRSSDIGAFHYDDNLARSLKRAGEDILELIPKLYDRPRVMTILREDDSEEMVKIDPDAGKALTEEKGPDGKPRKVFNPKVGKYGVTVDIGPSYATKRIEASESMMEFVKAFPQAAGLVLDLVAGVMDWPDHEKFEARFARALPPQLLLPEQKDMSPQTQALVSHLQQQVQQHQQIIQAAGKQLQDKQEEIQVKREKIARDFEAKVLAIVEKHEGKDKDINLEKLRIILEEVRRDEEPTERPN